MHKGDSTLAQIEPRDSHGFGHARVSHEELSDPFGDKRSVRDHVNSRQVSAVWPGTNTGG